MLKKSIFVFISVICIFISVICAYAQDSDSYTIVTYYPSPYGSYNALGTNKLAVDITGVAVPSEYAAMQNGDVHIGRSLIIGAGGGSGFAYDELDGPPDNRPRDGDVLIKGSVGIGTTGPNAALHIANPSSGPVAIFDTNTNVNNFYTTRLGATDQALSIGVDDASVYFESIQDENASNTGNMIFRTDNDGTATGYFAFQNKSGTNFVRINSSGSVGIGTTDPGTNRLKIEGGTTETAGGLIIEKRTTNPGSPVTGQMWLCTDTAPYCQ